mmetsp:Transcript_29361/g.75729  ORF Transcript_29361/g.75729 Transcript_29361/m.75729 type:complete len:203 (+) Transcript_29361:208-816(+)
MILSGLEEFVCSHTHRPFSSSRVCAASWIVVGGQFLKTIHSSFHKIVGFVCMYSAILWQSACSFESSPPSSSASLREGEGMGESSEGEDPVFPSDISEATIVEGLKYREWVRSHACCTNPLVMRSDWGLRRRERNSRFAGRKEWWEELHLSRYDLPRCRGEILRRHACIAEISWVVQSHQHANPSPGWEREGGASRLATLVE